MKIIESKKNKFNRILDLDFGNKVLTTPTYFPAISSVEKNKHFTDLARLIIKTSYPQMLISSYDYHYYFNSKLASSINNYNKKCFLFVDSGGYESFWNNSKKWNYQLYEKTIKKIKSDFHTSYDEENDVNKKLEKTFDNIIDGGSLVPSSQYIPIFHAKNSKLLLKLIKVFLAEYPFAISLLAVREKELGSTILERAKTVYSIRKLINSVGGDQVLHVLGAGHPTSISLYAYCGADSFDSTDWYTHLLDIKTCNLREMSQLDIINGISPSVGKIKNQSIRTLVHNLDSYHVLMKKIQAMIKNGNLKKFLSQQGITQKMVSDVTK